MDKIIKEYNLPINDEKIVKQYNKEFDTESKSFEQHVEKTLDDILDTIIKLGKDNGFYLNDTIKLKVEFEYQPEDKQISVKVLYYKYNWRIKEDE